MGCKRLSTFLFALGGAVVLTAATAGADAGHAFTVTLSSAATSANADITTSLTFGAIEGDTYTIDFPAGWRLAHGDAYGNELASNPNDGEQMGSGAHKASWTVAFCGVSTRSTTLTWEEDMTGAPPGAVAHWVMTTASVGDTHLWVIEEDDVLNDYRVTMDLNQSTTCAAASQPSDQYLSLVVNGATSFGRVSIQNPGTSGCYPFSPTLVDVTLASHGGYTAIEVGSGHCV